jgi:hypothetical protein
VSSTAAFEFKIKAFGNFCDVWDTTTILMISIE